MKVEDIPIKDIRIQENIRQKDVDENIAELMQSIKDSGLLEPIGVKENHNGYILIWGFRRLTAYKKLGWKTIPAVIFLNKDEEITEEEFFILNATENIQRRSNNLLEFGRVCKILRRTMSIGEIAKRLGVPKRRVNNALDTIARIPFKWQKKIKLVGAGVDKDGDIPLSTAGIIADIRKITPKQKEDLLEYVSKQDAGNREIRVMGALMSKGMSFVEARELMHKYRTISVQLLVKKDKVDELTKDKSILDFVADSLNSEVGDKDFCFRYTSK